MSLLKFIEKKEEKSPIHDKERARPRLLFYEVTDLFERLLTTRSTLEKQKMIKEFLVEKKDKIPLQDYFYFYQLSAKDFHNYDFREETGVAIGLYLQAVSQYLNIDKEELQLHYKGDWGETVLKFIIKQDRNKNPKKLKCEDLVNLIIKLPQMIGKGSQKKKIGSIVIILKKCSPLEAKYVTRLILGGSLKTGAKDKLIQKAFYEAFPELIKYEDQINYAAKTRGVNFGQAVFWILSGDINTLFKYKMEPGYPVQLMLAERGSIEVVNEFPHFVEYKYDGFRLQSHFNGSKVKLFSRGLEDHTDNLADIVHEFKKAVDGHTCIVDGEILAYDKKTGHVLPFQTIIRRKRKYDRLEVAQTMRTEYRIFDVLYFDGKDITSKPLKERREILEDFLKTSEVIQLSNKIETQNAEEALSFIDLAKKEGHEGGILKKIDSPYLIGERDKAWTKIKPKTYDMDGCLVGGQYGTGKRRGMISRIFVAFPDENEDYYEVIGAAIGSGMSEDIMLRLKDLFEKEGTTSSPDNVRVDEKIAELVEVWIQPEEGPVLEIVADSFSWKTPEGQPPNEKNIPRTEDNSRIDLTKISLRFPRFKGIREHGKEANTIQEVIKQVEQQLKESKQ